MSFNRAYSTGNRVIIPAYSQPNNQTLRVMLLVRSTFDPLRTATTKQSIVFSSSRHLINVNIACVSNCNGNKYTIQMPIHLKGQCLRCQNKKITKWIWRVEGLPVEGASKRLIFDVKETKKRLLGIHLNVEAVNRYNSKFSYYGTSWVFLEKNMGPADTMCTISPRVGNAHETQFLLQCNQSQARFKPLQYCIGVENFLVDECKSDEDIQVRLPPTEHVVVMICDHFFVCDDVTVTVEVRRLEMDDSDNTVKEALSLARHWLEYADWQKAFLLLYQVAKLIKSKGRLLNFIDTIYVYEPQTTVQLAHLVRLTKRVVLSLEPLDDMEVNVVARMLQLISSTFRLIINSNELNTLMDIYYETMVNELCDILNKLNTEWEYIPKSQCRAESESCLNIDNFRNRLEQMSVLRPQGLEHINNWLHAHWKLSSCLFYMGMGTARRLHPEEGPKLIERSTFSMRMESFDLDQDRNIEFQSADSMHTLIFTDKLLDELKRRLRTDEVLISIRSHKQSQYWWYPEQESHTQVLVVNAYTINNIWKKSQEVAEPFQYISKLKMNFSEGDSINEPSRQISNRGIDFDDPEEDIENVIHDCVYTPLEVRMYRTELFGHSVLGVTFTQADIDYYVLIRMTNIPELNEMERESSTCLVRAGVLQPTTLLLRNRCDKSQPVYIYLRAANISEPWNNFFHSGAFFAFTTDIRSCRIWNYARPEPRWQNFACMPELNKSIYFGIHCRCNYISDFDADGMPIIVVPMNLKCHLERPIVGQSYQIIIFFFSLASFVIIYIFYSMQSVSDWDKNLYTELYPIRGKCYRGDLVLMCTFGGRYNAGTSANIIFAFKFSNQTRDIIVYQDPVFKTFKRNSTISFRLQNIHFSIPTGIAMWHDNSGVYPHFFCRNLVLCDMHTKEGQLFSIQQWIQCYKVLTVYKTANAFSLINTDNGKIHSGKLRFLHAMENFMGNWYLFQPIIGPWRFGTERLAFCKWERSCIFIGKLFIAITFVVLFFGRTEPMACDPSPKKYNDIDVVLRLCFSCYITNCIVQASLETAFRAIGVYDFI
ncbi:uncharacterized protein LOC116803386 [Drosophila sechellia]|uniref:uncharacterized protein LOC116803386 n=1 Tax=Drosophila sechellia TaxID=7238 RepID=UPI0013DD94EA|nr:uncharacterized protein LOC116803386 [Drosophila sechellia]